MNISAHVESLAVTPAEPRRRIAKELGDSRPD